MLKEGIGDLKKSAREWARDLNGIEAVVNTPNPLEEFLRARVKNKIGIIIRITPHETLRIRLDEILAILSNYSFFNFLPKILKWLILKKIYYFNKNK